MAIRIETRTIAGMTELLPALIAAGHATQLAGRHRKQADTTASEADVKEIARRIKCTVYVGGLLYRPPGRTT